MYSGGVPELIDGDVFRTIVPLELSFNGVNDNRHLNDNLNDKLNDNNEAQLILAFIKQKGEISTSQAAQIIDRSHSTARRVLLGLVDDDILAPSGANKNKVYHLKGDKQ